MGNMIIAMALMTAIAVGLASAGSVQLGPPAPQVGGTNTITLPGGETAEVTTLPDGTIIEHVDLHTPSGLFLLIVIKPNGDVNIIPIKLNQPLSPPEMMDSPPVLATAPPQESPAAITPPMTLARRPQQLGPPAPQ